MEIKFQQLIKVFGGAGLTAFWIWTSYLTIQQGHVHREIEDASWFEIPAVLIAMGLGILLAFFTLKKFMFYWYRNPTIKLQRPTRKRDEDKIPTARVI